tara:strand:- start:489 stop:806 length:318 start_codon:yes stop_codon:yes gene_type:complete
MSTAQEYIDQELAQFGWVESVATNSISNFKSPKSNVEEEKTDEKNTGFLDTFIYHLIFYAIFCYALFLYICVDLGIGPLIANKVSGFYKSSNIIIKPSLFTTISN